MLSLILLAWRPHQAIPQPTREKHLFDVIHSYERAEQRRPFLLAELKRLNA